MQQQQWLQGLQHAAQLEPGGGVATNARSVAAAASRPGLAPGLLKGLKARGGLFVGVEGYCGDMEGGAAFGAG